MTPPTWYLRTTSAGVSTPYFSWLPGCASSADWPQTSATNNWPIFCSNGVARKVRSGQLRCPQWRWVCWSPDGEGECGWADAEPVVTASKPTSAAAAQAFQGRALAVVTKPPVSGHARCGKSTYASRRAQATNECVTGQ